MSDLPLSVKTARSVFAFLNILSAVCRICTILLGHIIFVFLPSYFYAVKLKRASRSLGLFLRIFIFGGSLNLHVHLHGKSRQSGSFSMCQKINRDDEENDLVSLKSFYFPFFYKGLLYVR